MVYELRIYHMNSGKMENICSRFKDHTLRLFEKHGIKVSDFWIDAKGNETIYYVCEFESEEKRISLWDSFRNDPEWMKAREESEKDGAIVSSVDSYVMTDASFFTKTK